MLAISIAVGCGNCVEMAFLSVFSFLGITSELFLMSSHIDSLIINPPSIIVLRYYLVFYFTLFYFHLFHFKYCSYEYYS